MPINWNKLEYTMPKPHLNSLQAGRRLGERMEKFTHIRIRINSREWTHIPACTHVCKYLIIFGHDPKTQTHRSVRLQPYHHIFALPFSIPNVWNSTLQLNAIHIPPAPSLSLLFLRFKVFPFAHFVVESMVCLNACLNRFWWQKQMAVSHHRRSPSHDTWLWFTRNTVFHDFHFFLGFLLELHKVQDK